MEDGQAEHMRLKVFVYCPRCRFPRFVWHIRPDRASSPPNQQPVSDLDEGHPKSGVESEVFLCSQLVIQSVKLRAITNLLLYLVDVREYAETSKITKQIASPRIFMYYFTAKIHRCKLHHLKSHCKMTPQKFKIIIITL